jgi:transposase
MEAYVGLDVSLKETSICVVDGSGKIVSEGKVLSAPLALAEFLSFPSLPQRAMCRRSRASP